MSCGGCRHPGGSRSGSQRPRGNARTVRPARPAPGVRTPSGPFTQARRSTWTRSGGASRVWLTLLQGGPGRGGCHRRRRPTSLDRLPHDLRRRRNAAPRCDRSRRLRHRHIRLLLHPTRRAARVENRGQPEIRAGAKPSSTATAPSSTGPTSPARWGRATSPAARAAVPG